MIITPPPISYCRACGIDEHSIDKSWTGWGDRLKTICRTCLKYIELDKHLNVPNKKIDSHKKNGDTGWRTFGTLRKA